MEDVLRTLVQVIVRKCQIESEGPPPQTFKMKHSKYLFNDEGKNLICFSWQRKLSILQKLISS